MTSLLDILKEADLRVGFTSHFKSATVWEVMDRSVLQKRLLLCLYALGTNTGLKRVSAGDHGETYKDLQYVRRRFLDREQLRAANAAVANAIFAARLPQIWGEGTTACASDSKKFGAWDQNLLTEWHIRYRGAGIMIYWSVEKNAACIYSQLKSCSSSEVAAMIEGLLRHCTTMEVERNFVDTHGQSEVAFAFCKLLNFDLLPRLRGLHAQRLYRPETGKPDAYPNLQLVLTRPINWELIRQQYDQMVKYATALRLGTAETEAILRRFTRNNLQHPTYQALAELGKAVKTIFLYVIWNSAMSKLEKARCYYRYRRLAPSEGGYAEHAGHQLGTLSTGQRTAIRPYLAYHPAKRRSRRCNRRGIWSCSSGLPHILSHSRHRSANRYTRADCCIRRPLTGTSGTSGKRICQGAVTGTATYWAEWAGPVQRHYPTAPRCGAALLRLSYGGRAPPDQPRWPRALHCWPRIRWVTQRPKPNITVMNRKVTNP